MASEWQEQASRQQGQVATYTQSHMKEEQERYFKLNQKCKLELARQILRERKLMKAIANDDEEQDQNQPHDDEGWGRSYYGIAEANQLSAMDPEYQTFVMEKRQQKAQQILQNKKKLQQERVQTNVQKRQAKAERWKKQVQRINKRKKRKEQDMQNKHAKAESILQDIQIQKKREIAQHQRMRQKKSAFTKHKKALMERSQKYQRDVLRKEREKREKKVEHFKKQREKMYVSMQKLKSENANQRTSLVKKYKALRKSQRLDNETIKNELGIDLEEAQRILASPPKKRESMLPSLSRASVTAHPTPDMSDAPQAVGDDDEQTQVVDDIDVEEEGEGLYDDDLDSLTLRTTVIAKSRLSKLSKYHPSLKSRIQSLPYNNMEINKLAKLVKVKKASNKNNLYGTRSIPVDPYWQGEEENLPTGEFTLTIMQGEALDTLASLQPKDMTVTVTLNETSHTTSQSSQGDWQSVFTMKSDMLASDVLSFELKEQDTLLGTTSLALEDTLHQSGKTITLPIDGVESDLPNKATLSLSVAFVMKEAKKKKKKSKKAREQAARVRERELEGIRRAAAKRRKKEAAEEAAAKRRSKSPSMMVSSPQEDCFEGILSIKIIKAMYLGEPQDSINPYIKLTVGDMEKQTNVKAYALHPSYNQSFKFQVEDAHQPIHVTVYDQKDEKQSPILASASWIPEGIKPYLRKRVDIPLDLESGLELGSTLTIELQSPTLRIPDKPKSSFPRKKSKPKRKAPSRVAANSSSKTKPSTQKKSTQKKASSQQQPIKPQPTTKKNSTKKTPKKKKQPKKDSKNESSKPKDDKKDTLSEFDLDDTLNFSNLSSTFQDTPAKKKKKDDLDTSALLADLSDGGDDVEGEEDDSPKASKQEDDLDDFLNTMDDPSEKKDSPKKKVDSSNDLDDFLNSMDSELASPTKKDTTAEEPKDDDLDFDNFMDDIDMMTSSTPTKKEKKVDASVDDIDLDNFDIDNI